MSGNYPNLFSPLKIGPTTIKNRITMTAHLIVMEENGVFTDKAVAYYEERAAGGLGLMITGPHDVHDSMYMQGSTILWDDRAVESFRKIADALHKYDCKVFGQIWHPGRQAGGRGGKEPPWAPSAVPVPMSVAGQVGEMPHAMTIDEIKSVVQGYGSAAARLEKTGYDGCEIHASHGYLLTQFLSPYSNKRDDEYGGSLENRMRIIYEVIDSVRSSVSDNFVVGMRLIGDEFVEGGLGVDDAVTVAPRFEAAGKLDYISISAGNYSAIGAIFPGMYFPPGCFVHMAAAVKEVVELPVICAGRINDPIQAEEILTNHQADVVAMTRGHICDAELSNKALEGREDEIRRCLACNEGCIGALAFRTPIACAFNARAGKETELIISPARQMKKVTVIGGGPAGMEAARVAAMRGHEVTLIESSDQLGGQMTIAPKAPGRSDFDEVPRYYRKEMERLNVLVETGKEVSADEIKSLSPDVVIVATGSNPVEKDFPGSGAKRTANVRDVLNGKVDLDGVKKAVVIVDGYHQQGLSAADLLSDREIQVTCLVPGPLPGMDMGGFDFNTVDILVPRLRKKGVNVIENSTVKDISGTKVEAGIGKGKTHIEEDVDLVVIAIKAKKNDPLSEQLKEAGLNVIVIGEAEKSMKLMDAVADGFNVGNSI